MIMRLRHWWRKWGFLTSGYGPIDDFCAGPDVLWLRLRSWRIGRALTFYFETGLKKKVYWTFSSRKDLVVPYHVLWSAKP